MRLDSGVVIVHSIRDSVFTGDQADKRFSAGKWFSGLNYANHLESCGTFWANVLGNVATF